MSAVDLAAGRMRSFMRSHIAGADNALDLFGRHTFCEGRLSGLRDADAITTSEAHALGRELEDLRARRAATLAGHRVTGCPVVMQSTSPRRFAETGGSQR